MKALLPVAAVAAVLLSGCFAPSPASIGATDAVHVLVEGRDASGKVVYPQAENVLSGDPLEEGDLAIRLRHELAGHAPGQTVTFTVQGNEYPGRVALDHQLGSSDVVQEVPASEFGGRLPAVGDTLPRTPLSYKVLAVTNETVTVQALVQDGFRYDIPEYGLALVYHVAGGQMTRTLEADAGKTFTAEEGDRNFAPGAYRIVGVQGDRVVLEHNAFPTMPVTYTAKVLRTAPVVGQDGNYIARDVALNATASTGPMPAAHADDGHGHDH